MKGPRIDDRINFLKGIERDWKDWSAGKKPGRVNIRWIGIPISLIAALIVTEILNADTSLFWLLSILSLLGLPLWFFYWPPLVHGKRKYRTKFGHMSRLILMPCVPWPSLFFTRMS